MQRSFEVLVQLPVLGRLVWLIRVAGDDCLLLRVLLECLFLSSGGGELNFFVEFCVESKYFRMGKGIGEGYA